MLVNEIQQPHELHQVLKELSAQQITALFAFDRSNRLSNQITSLKDYRVLCTGLRFDAEGQQLDAGQRKALFTAVKHKLPPCFEQRHFEATTVRVDNNSPVYSNVALCYLYVTPQELTALIAEPNADQMMDLITTPGQALMNVLNRLNVAECHLFLDADQSGKLAHQIIRSLPHYDTPANRDKLLQATPFAARAAMGILFCCLFSLKENNPQALECNNDMVDFVVRHAGYSYEILYTLKERERENPLPRPWQHTYQDFVTATTRLRRQHQAVVRLAMMNLLLGSRQEASPLHKLPIDFLPLIVAQTADERLGATEALRVAQQTVDRKLKGPEAASKIQRLYHGYRGVKGRRAALHAVTTIQKHCRDFAVRKNKH